MLGAGWGGSRKLSRSQELAPIYSRDRVPRGVAGDALQSYQAGMGGGLSRPLEMNYPCGRLRGPGPEESKTAFLLVQSGDKQRVAASIVDGERALEVGLWVPVCTHTWSTSLQVGGECQRYPAH